MANKSGVLQMEEIVKRLQNSLVEAKSPNIYKTLGNFAIGIIVKRTRLGYGVSRFLAPKTPLKSLSSQYVKQRKGTKLSPLTSAKKSNLTRTSQMLDSVKITKQTQTGVFIGPTGRRNDSVRSNAQIAAYNEERGRIFLNLSDLEYAQVFREYRKTFGDLLKKRRLLK